MIPKDDNPMKITSFRPISLCNVIYKIISKVLVNEIRPQLDKVISPLQNSFTLGCKIVDNILVAQEIFHHIHKYKNKKGLIALKIDLEKAYDRVNWDFLHEALMDFGFHSYFVNLMMHCVSSSSSSIL